MAKQGGSYFWILTIIIFLCLGFVPKYASAHLDPPTDPALQEVIWLNSVTVHDDMDTFAAGELSINYVIVPSPPHTMVTGTIPGGSVSAPPNAAFPATFPIVLYNHLNCNPLERPIVIALDLIDDDFWGPESSTALLTFGNAGGIFVVGNNEFTYTITVGIFPAPEFSCLEDSPTNPMVPPPPPEPSTGLVPPYPPIIPPWPPEIPPEEEPDVEVNPTITIEEFNERQTLNQITIEVKEGLQRSDVSLAIGITIGVIVSGTALGIVIWRIKQR